MSAADKSNKKSSYSSFLPPLRHPFFFFVSIQSSSAKLPPLNELVSTVWLTLTLQILGFTLQNEKCFAFMPRCVTRLLCAMPRQGQSCGITDNTKRGSPAHQGNPNHILTVVFGLDAHKDPSRLSIQWLRKPWRMELCSQQVGDEL